MRIRQRMNVSYATGSVAVAAVGGWLSGSVLIFLLLLAGLLAANVYSGEIRLKPRGPGNKDQGGV